MRQDDKWTNSKIFGIAADFYRVRLLKIDEELPADLEWEENILYTSPKAYPSKLKVTYRLQILAQDKKEKYEIANLRDKRDAKKRLRAIKDDLRELTKMEFDAKYDIKDAESAKQLISLERSLNLPRKVLDEKVILFAGINDGANDKE